MKPFLLVIPIYFYLLTVQSLAQDYSSYYKGQKQKYSISPNKLIITYNEPTALDKSERLLSKEKLKKIGHGMNRKIHIVTLDSELSKEKITSIVKEIELDQTVAYASPVLISASGDEVGGLTNRFIIQLKHGSSKSDVEKMINEKHLSIKPYEFDSRTFLVSVAKGSGENSINIANRFFESGLFEFSEPDLLLFVRNATSDQYFGNQWSLTAMNDKGGMSVTAAWSFTTGCSSIKVAILDDGVELTHPDLAANLVQGYDATGGGSNGASGDAISAHGTVCAGIVGAVANNGIGVAGVAFNCRIMPVRIVTTAINFPNNLMVASAAAAGIDWAWQNGASILSMSWYVTVGQSGIDAAINRAVTQGRNNLGSVLFAASGNHKEPAQLNPGVSYPATNQQVIAVGAVNQPGGPGLLGERASFSNYGAELDIAAPGVNIYTIDLQGQNYGYSRPEFYPIIGDASGNYLTNFGGTSAACPNAAGVMALILSVNPTLTLAQARSVLQSNTDSNGGWNQEVGYGIVNAYKAISSMIGGPVTGPSMICSSGTFTYPNLPAGLTVTWSSNNPYILNFPNPSSGYSVHGSGNGPVIVSPTLHNSCGTVSVPPFNVWVGTPTNYYPSGYAEECSSVPIHFDAVTSDPSTNVYLYRWYLDGTSLGETSNSYTDIYASIGYHQAGLQTANDCGWSESIETQGFQIFSCGGFAGTSVYPNPTDKELHVNTPAGNETSEIILFNSSQEKVIDLFTNENKITLSVKSLPEGVYYLHILSGDQKIEHRVMIKH